MGSFVIYEPAVQIEESINVPSEVYHTVIVSALHIDPKLTDEAARLAALDRYEILDTTPEETFDKLTALVRTTLGVPIAIISLLDAKRQWLKSAMGRLSQEMPREHSFCTHTIKTRTPLVISDSLEDERFAQNPVVVGPPYIRSYLGIPLETPDGYNIGALCAIDSVPRYFNPQDVETLKSFAEIVVDVLELRNLARLDHLTKALGRRAFLEEARRAISRSERYGHQASIVMFDIDHFKRINDTYGHSAGDAVLRAVGRACNAAARDYDSFGRMGGEEFALLLQETAEGARDTAERYREILSTLHIPGYSAINITASFGIASLMRGASVAQWIAKADAALYAAKRGGRNQCRLAG